MTFYSNFVEIRSMKSGGLVSLCVVTVLTTMWLTPAGHYAQPQTMPDCDRITYSHNMLKEINRTVGDRPRLPNALFKHLQNLDISQIKPRGNRAGKAKHSTAIMDKPITTIVNNSSLRPRKCGSLNK